LSLTVANGNNSVAIALNPGISGRQSNIQKAYEFYRFTKLRIRIPPWARFETTWPQNTTCASGALGYYPELTTATTTTVGPAAVLGLQASIPLQGALVNANTVGGTTNVNLISSGLTTTQSLVVPSTVLLGTSVKWFRTNATTSSEVAEITQGQLLFTVDDAAGANTVVLRMQLIYTIEYAGEVDATLLTLSSKPRPLLSISQSDDEKTDEEQPVYVKVPSSAKSLTRSKGPS